MRYLLVLALATIASAASVDGLQIHSTTTGKGPKTVFLVHGWTCDETSWESQVPVLSKDYRVVTLDLPGHGKSGMPKEFSMVLFARAIEAVRAEVSADRVVLAGHSMGVPVVREYARLYPQRTAGLVLVDGPLSLPPGITGDFAARAPRMGGPNGKQAREGMIRGMFSPATTPVLQKRVLDMMLTGPEATAVGAVKAAFDRSKWHDESFAEPVLVIVAGNGNSDREYMKSHFPKSATEKMDGTGHFVMLEKPDVFNKLLLAFLKKNAF